MKEQGHRSIEFGPREALKRVLVDTVGRMQHRSVLSVASTKWAANFLKMLFRVPEENPWCLKALRGNIYIKGGVGKGKKLNFDG